MEGVNARMCGKYTSLKRPVALAVNGKMEGAVAWSDPLDGNGRGWL